MVVNPVEGIEIKLINNTVYEGEIIDVNEDGIVIRKDSGGHSNRIPWLDLSQETLKQIITERGVDSDAAFYAEPYVEIPRQERIKQQEINVNPVPRVERPDSGAGFFASLMTPMGIVILGALFFANIFVAYEIAAYRNQSAALVCAISAVLPVLGPIIFLSLPPAEHYAEAEEEAEAPAAPPPPPKAAAPAGVGVPSGGGLSLAQQKAAPGADAEAKVFSHKEHSFNRRFIESQFSGFFRVVPSPAEKDLVLVFKTVKHQYVAKRITRISSTDVHIQLQRGGGGSNEVRIGFNEIVEIQVRHKDAK